MKKLKFYALILSALLASSGVWGNVMPIPEKASMAEPFYKNGQITWQTIEFAKPMDESLSKKDLQIKQKMNLSPKKATSANEAEINGKEYGTLSAAISAAEPGQTIKLLDNVWGCFYINKDITLDLNEHYIYYYYAWYVLYLDANVTIKNGSLYCYTWTYLDENDAATNKASYVIKANSGNIVLEDVKMDAGYSSYPYYSLDVCSGANVTMQGDSKIYGYYAAYNEGSLNIKGNSYINGVWHALYNKGSLDVFGKAKAESETGRALTSSAGSVDLYEQATLTSGDGDMTMKTWGTVFSMKEDVLVNDDGENIDNDGYSMPAFDALSGSYAIWGGTIKAPLTFCIQNDGSSPFNIYGGRFDCKSVNSEGNPVKAIAAFVKMNIFGGTFNNTAIELHSQFFNADFDTYAYDDNGDGTYTVRLKIAQNTDSKVIYFSLQDAIDAAKNNDEISLVYNVKEDVTVEGKSITFNTDGYTLTGNITASTGGEVIINSPTGLIDGQLIKENGGIIKVYFGQFKQDPTAYAPSEEGCKVAGPDAQGIYTVTQEVAQINGEGVKYTSFKAAIEAANAMSNPTVALLANARLDKNTINVTSSMTINLNGHSLFAVGDENSYIRISGKDIAVTIKDGTLTNASTASDFPIALIAQTKENTVTLSNLTITNKGDATCAIIEDGAKIVVGDDCSLSGTAYDLYVTSNGIVDNKLENISVCLGLNSVSLVNKVGCTISLSTIVPNTGTITLDNAGVVDVAGGVYESTIFAGTDNFQISGGVFFTAVKNATNVVGKIVSEKTWNEMAYKGVQAWEPRAASEIIVATIDGKNYYSLDDALLAIDANKVEKKIVLVNDVDVEITKDEQFTILEKQIVKIDLNGHKIGAVNNNKSNSAILFDVELGATLIVDDSSETPGVITYKNKNVNASLAYTINCEGVFTLKNGTIENTSKAGVVPYTIEIGKGGVLNVEGGLINHTSSYAVRYWADQDTRTVMNVSGGEIRGTRPVWIQLPQPNPGRHPFAEFNMTGGKLTCTVEGGEAFYVYTFGESLDNITINVSGNSTIVGRFLIGGGTAHGGFYNELTTIDGGTFCTSKAFKSFRPGAEHRCVKGGAFFFDETTTKNDYLALCDYVLNGHYVIKMCQNDQCEGVEGIDYFTHFGHKYVEGVCDGGEYWAVIDGEGPVESRTVIVSDIEPLETRKNQWGEGPKGIFGTGETPDIYTDVEISQGEVWVMSGTNGLANRLIIDEGAGIRIKCGASLEVGTGGIEVNGNGTGTTYVIVEPGGKLIANGTVINQNVSELFVQADADEGTGMVLLDPNVSYNNQPLATIQMNTYAKYIPTLDKYIWQHFGIPTIAAPASITNNKGCLTQYWQWNYELGDWEQVNYKQDKALNTPFRGYNLKTNYTGDDGVIYTFTGQIMGNKDAEFNLVRGFNFYGNSYLAPVDIVELIKGLQEAGDEIEWTVWMYDGQTDKFDLSNELTRIIHPEFKKIPALRGFFLKLSEGIGSSTGMSYTNTVWNPAKINDFDRVLEKQKVTEMTTSCINITSASKMSDQVLLAESSNFTANFDNGYDASKLMSEHSANLYAETMNGNLAVVASDDINGLYLTITTKDETTYTMTFSNVNGEPMTLVDHQTNARVQMVEGGTYSFTAPANTTSSNRFQIVKAPQVITGMENLEAQDSAKSIYTVFGQYVGHVNDWAILPAGVYVVNGEKVVK